VRTARIVVAACLALALVGCEAFPAKEPSAVSVPASPPIDEARKELNARSFDAMWERVATSYFRPKRLEPNGIDWFGVRETYRPQVAAAPTNEAARAAMNAALATLQETHFAVVAGDHRLESTIETSDGFVGISVREPADGDPAVWRVESGSPGATAGVRPGWTLVSIGGHQLWGSGTSDPPRSPIDVVRHIEGVERELAGQAGVPQPVVFRDGRQRERRVILTPSTMPADRIAKLGNLPAMDLRIDARTLADGVGYFGLSIFLDPPRVMPAWQRFLSAHASSPGVVIDLRGNPGGLGAMATGMAGFLVDRAGLKLGTMTTRDGSLDFMVNPRTPRYSGKVAVLVDGHSLSTSEILARGLQDLGRARVFGQPTPGAALPSTVMRLPSGDLFQYAVADYVSAKGERLEGKGVTPDEVVPLTRADLLANRDAPLEAALRWINAK
jgi:carboxyl-terminal processing protease